MVLPKSVKHELVSTTTKPVTQTALVDVNSASTNEICSVVEKGSNSRNVPKKIRKRKLKTNNLAGLDFIYRDK